jgi:hypothetical protein
MKQNIFVVPASSFALFLFDPITPEQTGWGVKGGRLQSEMGHI